SQLRLQQPGRLPLRRTDSDDRTNVSLAWQKHARVSLQCCPQSSQGPILSVPALLMMNGYHFSAVLFESPFVFIVDWRAWLREELEIIAKSLANLDVNLQLELDADGEAGYV